MKNEIRYSVWKNEADNDRPAMLPYNRFDVAVFVEGELTARRVTTLPGPTHVDDAVKVARLIEAELIAHGFVIRGIQVFGKYTADGCFCWSGKPLGNLGVTCGLVEWGACRAHMEEG